jgi:di/tricarboxylate transporter
LGNGLPAPAQPAVIAIGVGLLLTLPKVGVLDTKALRSVKFLLVVFVGGALSMGTVLAETEVLHLVIGRLLARLGPLLREAWQASVILYWSNVLYHFLLGNELTLVSTSLPVLLKLAEAHGYNAVALGLIWTFAAGGKLFAYQGSALVREGSDNVFYTPTDGAGQSAHPTRLGRP